MKKIYLSLFITLSSINAIAQYGLELGGIFGASSYLGEMGGKRATARRFIFDVQLDRTRTIQGLYVRKKFRDDFLLRSSFSYALLSGADASSLNPARVGRNLSFKNNIFELEADLEWMFYQPKNIGTLFEKEVDLQTYIYAGGALFHHDPYTTYNGKRVKLRPLKTEGVAYKPWQFSIPMGIGMAYIFGKKIKVGVEVTYRKVFTDYIDDVSTTYIDPNTIADPVARALANRRGELDPTLSLDVASDPRNYTALSQRGDPKNMDDFFYLQATVGYILKGKKPTYKIKNRGGAKRRRVRAKF